MKWFFNRCNRWHESICLLAGGALSEQKSIEVKAHIASCEHCQKFLTEIKAVAAPLANWEKHVTGVEPSRAVQTRWADAIHAASETKETPRPASGNFFHELWRELIWPCRRALTGIAALWLAMWVINSGTLGSRSAIALVHVPVSPAIWESYKEQKQLLVELIQPKGDQPAEPPRRRTLLPRSETHLGRWMC